MPSDPLIYCQAQRDSTIKDNYLRNRIRGFHFYRPFADILPKIIFHRCVAVM